MITLNGKFYFFFNDRNCGFFIRKIKLNNRLEYLRTKSYFPIISKVAIDLPKKHSNNQQTKYKNYLESLIKFFKDRKNNLPKMNYIFFKKNMPYNNQFFSFSR